MARLTAAGQTVAVAESLTGGLVTAALTDVAGASVVVRGGVLAYASDLKAQVLGVDEGLLARAGAVDADVAEQMADGVRSLMGATYGLATTGVAGPDPADGKPVGTVYVAVAGPGSSRVNRCACPGIGRASGPRVSLPSWCCLARSSMPVTGRKTLPKTADRKRVDPTGQTGVRTLGPGGTVFGYGLTNPMGMVDRDCEEAP